MTILPETTGPAVRAAIAALDSFGAVTQRQATQLLGMWTRYDELTPADIDLIMVYYRTGTPDGPDAPDDVPVRLVPPYVQSHRAGTR